jgi:hypothetical protein
MRGSEKPVVTLDPSTLAQEVLEDFAAATEGVRILRKLD